MMHICSKKIKVDEYKSRHTGETVSLYFEIRFIDSFKFKLVWLILLETCNQMISLTQKKL